MREEARRVAWECATAEREMREVWPQSHQGSLNPCETVNIRQSRPESGCDCPTCATRGGGGVRGGDFGGGWRWLAGECAEMREEARRVVREVLLFYYSQAWN